MLNQVNMSRDALQTALMGNICQVQFEKADGSIRDMRCTLKADLLPEDTEVSTDIVNEAVIPVYDLENNGFRSFRVANVRKFETV